MPISERKVSICLNALNRRVGKNIQLRRRKNHLSQRELSQQTLINEWTIARIESGQIAPTLEILCRFAIVLDCDVQDFFRP